MEKLNVKHKSIVTPGELLAKGEEFKTGSGTYRKDTEIYSSVVGIFKEKNKVLSVIKLGGTYMPKLGDYIIGKVEDMNFSNWFISIKGPFDAGLPIREASREYIDLDKHSMTDYFDYGDIVFGKIIDISGSNKITITLKEPELKKLVGGILISIQPSKVPRVIGTKGNMINLIKEKTKTQIIIGHNGYVWIKGKASDVKKVKEIIQLISEESHKSGLTDKIEKLLR